MFEKDVECMCKFALGVVVPIPRNALEGAKVMRIRLFVLKLSACELVVPRKLLLLMALPDKLQ